MKRTMSFLFVVVGGTWFALSATLPKDIIAVLEKVDKTNASYKTAKASLEMVMKMGPMSNSAKGELWIDNEARKFRVNLGIGPLKTLLIYDGGTLWNYDEANKTYFKQKFPWEALEENLFAIFPPVIAFSPSCKKNFTSEGFLQTLGKSSLEKTILNKKEVLLITFVDKEDNSQFRIVVDPKGYRILQLGMVMPSKENGGEVTFKILDFQSNISFPKDVFTFVPPPDAKEFTIPQGETLEGQMAPDFSLRALDGKEYSLSALKGKLVLIDFWATWCPPCKEELPIIEKLHQNYQAKGLVVLGISDEDRATVEPFIKENKITFPILMDSGGKVSQMYKVTAIPRVILIDKEGKVVKDITGYQKENEKILREAIEKLIGE